MPLAILLDEAGVDLKASWVVAEGADPIAMNISIPLSKIMDDCLVVLSAYNLFADGPAKAPHLGKPIDAEDAAKWDLNVFPDGKGLPAGRGTAAAGRIVYDEKCASCHGEGGRGATAEELAAGEDAQSQWLRLDRCETGGG